MGAYSRGIAFRMAVILSGAKDLSCPSERSFAPLRMTVGRVMSGSLSACLDKKGSLYICARFQKSLQGRGAKMHDLAIAGKFVTETFDYDGGRQVTVYVPPDSPGAVVFAGDGQRISQWGRFLEAADVPPTMIVGVHGLTNEKLRLQEYSPVFDAERFAAHEKFFVEDVRQWTASRFGVALPTERSAVFGASAGGEFAIALGLRHPHVYGAVFC